MADTPVKAIRAKCLDCSGGQAGEVKDCVITKCPLYPYRMGTNPNRKGIGRKHNDNLSKVADDAAEDQGN